MRIEKSFLTIEMRKVIKKYKTKINGKETGKTQF
jgi:hypothetical protein